MAVDLSNYFKTLEYEINPPGTTVYTMSQSEMLQRLIDAFWELRIYGVDILAAFSCDDNGIIAPLSSGVSSFGNYMGFQIPASWYSDDGSVDLGREVIQAIVITAGYRIALTNSQNLATMVRSQAGNVSYETQKSAQMQQAVLKNLMAKLDIVLTRLSDLGTTAVSVYDSIIQKTDNITYGIDEWWVMG
jgi:hypothetical protein